MPESIKIIIFIAYSRADTEYLEELRIHLTPIVRTGKVQIWYDGKIEAGIVWEAAIKENLHNADVILLLVSANAIASDYFYEKEMKDALKRHEKGEARVVPLIIRPCLWQTTPLANLQALPKDGKPITSWKDRAEAYNNAISSLWEMICNLEAEKEQERLAKMERIRLAKEEKITKQKQQERLAEMERIRIALEEQVVKQKEQERLAEIERIRLAKEEEIAKQKQQERLAEMERIRLTIEEQIVKQKEQERLAEIERTRQAKEEKIAKQKAAKEQQQLERNRLAEKARTEKQAKREELWKLPIKLKQKLVDFINNAPSQTKKYGLFGGLGIGIIAVIFAISELFRGEEEPPKVCKEHVHTFPSDDGKVGLIRCNDTLSATYDAIDGFSEGLAVVEKDSLFGFIDDKGILVTQAIYQKAGAFSNGKALVYLNENEFYINKKGECIEKCPKTEDEIRSGYRTIVLADKTWLAENLNVNVSGSWCYDNRDKNCDRYGRLYTWKAAKKACTGLGDGWRLPTDEEWKALAMQYGGYSDLKNGNDIGGSPNKAYFALIKGGSSQFEVLLSGYRNFKGEFFSLNSNGYYWSELEHDAGLTWYYLFNNDKNKVYHSYISYFDKVHAFSCRCIKD